MEYEHRKIDAGFPRYEYILISNVKRRHFDVYNYRAKSLMMGISDLCNE